MEVFYFTCRVILVLERRTYAHLQVRTNSIKYDMYKNSDASIMNLMSTVTLHKIVIFIGNIIFVFKYDLMLIVKKIGHRGIKTNDKKCSVIHSPVITSMNSERNTNIYWLNYVHPCNVKLL